MKKKCPNCNQELEDIIEIDIVIGSSCSECDYTSITHYIEGYPGEHYAVLYVDEN